MGRLLLVHFSDIHLGSELLGNEVSTSPRNPKSSLNGHDLLLCRHFKTATQNRLLPHTVARDFRLKPNERLEFVLSGDLTRSGSDNDFCLSYEWLLGHLTLPDRTGALLHVGLQIPPDHLHSVPGNHDQWDGRLPRARNFYRPFAYNGNLTPHWFKVTPWRVPIISPDNDFILDLFGVDSNSGMQGYRSNLRAKGLLSTHELTELEKLLIQSTKDEHQDRVPRMRTIVCHHSFERYRKTKPLDPASVAELTRLAHQFNVATILTGHMHSVLHREHRSATGQVFWELRAATPVQRDPQPALHGFWVHELKCDLGVLAWEAWVYELDANKTKFVRQPRLWPIR